VSTQALGDDVEVVIEPASATVTDHFDHNDTKKTEHS